MSQNIKRVLTMRGFNGGKQGYRVGSRFSYMNNIRRLDVGPDYLLYIMMVEEQAVNTHTLARNYHYY